jgi:hypothetical protein
MRAVDVRQVVLWLVAVLLLVRLDELVSPPAPMAVQALGEWVDEYLDVTRCDPHLRSEDHRRVDPDDVVSCLDHGPPPLLADVLLELDAERTVVPGGALSAVDLA